MTRQRRFVLGATFLVLGLPIVVLAATGHLDFAADDYWHLCALRDVAYTGGPTPDNLFRFWSGRADNLAAMQTGAVPWFTDPELKIVFWRPLTTALHRLDFALFGASAAAAKVHSLGWYALLVWVVARIFRRMIRDERARFVAVLVFTMCAAHWQIIAWIASRNALVTAALGLCGLLCHLRWRQDRWKPGAALGPLFLAAGLAAGEAALGVLGYVVAIELVGVFSRGRPLTPRLLATAPMLATACAWLVAYSAQGFGTKASGAYLDPIHEPLPFLAQLPGRLLAMHGMQYLGFPPDLWFLRPDAHGVAVAVGVVALAVLGTLAALVWPRLRVDDEEDETHLDQRHVLGAFALGAVLAMVPQAAGFLGARSLTLPSVGGSLVIGVLLVVGWSAIRDRGVRDAPRYAGGAALLALAAANLVLAPAGWFVSTALYMGMDSVTERVATAMELTGSADEIVVVLQSPDPFLERYLPFQRRTMGLATPQRWFTLSVAPHAHEVTTIAPGVFELRVLDGEMMASPFEQLLRRADRPIEVGYALELGAIRVNVMEVGATGPRRVRFTLSSPDDVRLFAWQNGTIAPFELPPAGRPVVLPWVPGPTSI